MTMQMRQVDQIGPVAAAPIVLQPGTWQYKLMLYLNRLQLQGKPTTIVIRLGDCPVNWLRGVPDGRE
jgi:hypothetical protein